MNPQQGVAQSDHPPVADSARIYSSLEQYVLFLTHLKAYEEASTRWPAARILD